MRMRVEGASFGKTALSVGGGPWITGGAGSGGRSRGCAFDPLVTEWSRIGHDSPKSEVTVPRQKGDVTREHGTASHRPPWANSDWGSRGREFKSRQPDRCDQDVCGTAKYNLPFYTAIRTATIGPTVACVWCRPAQPTPSGARKTLGCLPVASPAAPSGPGSVVRGVGFGPGGEGYVRFALIEEQRIAQAVRNLRGVLRLWTPSGLVPQSTSTSTAAVSYPTGSDFCRPCASSIHLVGIGVGALELKPEPASGKVWAQDTPNRVDHPVK